MGRLINENDVLNVLCRELCHPGAICPDGYCEEVRKKLKKVPSVDAVPVIRCKYCKHHGYKGGIPYCSKQDYGYGWEDNDFCSKGEHEWKG